MDISHGVDNDLLATLVESTDINKSNNAQSVRRAWYQVAAQYASAKGLSTVDLESIKGALQRRWNHMRSRAKVNKVVSNDPMGESTNTTVIMNPKMEHVVEVIQTDGNDGATVVKQIQIPGGTIEVNPDELTSQVPSRLLQQPPQQTPQSIAPEQTRRKRGRPGGVLAAPSFKKIEHDIGLHQGRELHLVRMKIARLEEESQTQNLENQRVFAQHQQREVDIKIQILQKRQELEEKRLQAELRSAEAEAQRKEAEAGKAKADREIAELELEKAKRQRR